MIHLLHTYISYGSFILSPSVWLPRTPAAKKPAKRTFAHVGAGNQESTFHDGSEKKKLKIDDLSTIDGSASEANESIINGSRSLRPRRGCAAKASVTTKQKAKRNLKKSSMYSKVLLKTEVSIKVDQNSFFDLRILSQQ